MKSINSLKEHSPMSGFGYPSDKLIQRDIVIVRKSYAKIDIGQSLIRFPMAYHLLS